MKGLRVPSWLMAGVLDRYHAGASHLFLLHGNVRDVQPFGRDYVPLAEGLRRLAARRAILVSYDVSSGLTFPDAEREKAFRKALGLKTGAIPSDPAKVLILLDALLTSERAAPGSVAVVIDYAHALAPSGPAGSAERQNVTTLARWASDPKVADRRPLVLLIAPAAGDVAEEVYAGASGAEVVAVPRPDLAARADFAAYLKERHPGTAWEMTPDQLAAETGGLALVQMEDIVQRAGGAGAGATLSRASIVERKIDLLRQEY